MRYFKNYGFVDFIIAAGYKKIIIDKYYNNSKIQKIKVVDTGKNTQTGGRLLN